MSDYLDVASDVENMCVEEGGVDIFLEDKDNVMHGRLRKCTGFWREIGASQWVLDILENGYRLPFVKKPPVGVKRNQSSCKEHEQFVDEAVAALVQCGSAATVEEGDLECISPLGVVKGARKLRLILDLRQVNVCLKKYRFKLEDIRTAAKLFRAGDFVITFDLKSGYHHVDMAEDHWRYLGFSWKGQFYCFKSLPFGLSTAPYLFNKLVKVLVRYWREKGIKCMMFFDDGSAGAETQVEAVEVAQVVRQSLNKAGWKINEEKSCLIPSQRPTILGFVLDLVAGKVLVSERRVKSLREQLTYLFYKQRPNAKECARLTGLIISMYFALGPVARLRTRGLYDTILKRRTWFHRTEWAVDARNEVEFWYYCFEEFHGRLFISDPSIVAVISTWSDASDVAWGGFALSCGEHSAKGNWPHETRQANKSSTWRELKAIELVLESLVHLLKGKECRHRTDNQAAAHILQVGSKVPELQQLACKIFTFCREFGIKLIPEWIPREENERADQLSKLVDTDDWKLSVEVFHELEETWGPHSLDCFASSSTRQLDRFCSRWWNPGCVAVDAFTVSWEKENLWMCPPLYLIGDVIRRVGSVPCHGTLIVPEWKSAWWWPLLFSGDRGAPFVRSWIYLPRMGGLFEGGTCPWNWFDGGRPRCEVLAIRLCSMSQCECGMV